MSTRQPERESNMLSLFSKTVDALSGMLNYRSQRHQVLLANIANLDVPEYRSADLILKRSEEKDPQGLRPVQLQKTQAGHMSGKGIFPGSAGEYEVTVTEEKGSLDREMASLSENHLMYNATIEMLARKFRSLNTVLKETK